MVHDQVKVVALVETLLFDHTLHRLLLGALTVVPPFADPQIAVLLAVQVVLLHPLTPLQVHLHAVPVSDNSVHVPTVHPLLVLVPG